MKRNFMSIYRHTIFSLAKEAVSTLRASKRKKAEVRNDPAAAVGERKSLEE